MKLPAAYSKMSFKARKACREQYIKEQEGRCYYCNEKLDGPVREDLLKLTIHKEYYPSGFFKHPIHLHHDHGTDLTLGAVHNLCNAILFEYHGE